jgi:asparagine synthase (glutamine-hydrolysing)
MCGICGVYDRSGAVPGADIISKMMDTMVDRGPDDSGTYIAPTIGLGHRRLSIIDLSESGRQPMSNEDKTVWLVFNGEIYNFPELRKFLIDKGHIFKSNTDTEVLVHGYEEWGLEKLLKKINGMFAFALWDANKRELVLVRDRLGVKPLFYFESGGRVYFASDIKAIWVACNDELSLDYAAMDSYLNFYCIPQEYTIFQGIKKVPPAHYIKFTRNGSNTGRYWFLSFGDKDGQKEEEYLEGTIYKIREAVGRRLISDVPLGAFLSGGVDSSVVVALMTQFSSEVRTFSVGFTNESYNELKYARAVAKRFSTDHHEIIIEPDALEVLPRLVWSYGEPFGDSSAIPTYYVSKAARELVKVALTGDGGDESFGGYPNIQAVYVASVYKKLFPSSLRRGILPLISNLLYSNTGHNPLLLRFKTLTEYGRRDLRESFRLNGIWFGKFKENLYSQELKGKLSSHDPYRIYDSFLLSADGANDVDKALFVDMNTRLPNDYLTKVDVATMANSLEARSPFLDYELVEYAARIPAKTKLKLFRQKYLLKRTALKLGVPHEAIYRKKWGFGIPIGFWFRGRLGSLLKNILLSDRALKRGYFNYGYLRTLLENHLSGREDHTHRLWSLLWLELWHLIFIDRVLNKDSNLYDMV